MSKQTEAVLNNHLEALGAGDIDRIMKDYNEDSILILPEVTLKGLDAIRATFSEFFNGLFKPGTYEFTMDRVEIIGEVAYIVWHSVNQGVDVTLGTDTFLVRDSKIVVQTFAGKIEAK
jgi:ketosteroid isomerase-like protein